MATAIAPSRPHSVPRAPGPVKPVIGRQQSKGPAHLPLHRRLLFPYDGVEKALPPFIASDSPDPEIQLINERLYQIIALALRAYVLSWYPRISPRDRTLLPAINSSILTPVLRPILTSLHSNPEPLLQFIVLDLPTLLNLHLRTYREAVQAASLGLSPSIADAYHARLPLMAITPAIVSSSGEAGSWDLFDLYLTSLADALWRHFLPLDEYASPVQRLMAREILGRTVLGGVGKRLAEPWFWYSLLLKFTGEPQPQGDKESKSRSGRSEVPRDGDWTIRALALSEWTLGMCMKIWFACISLWRLGTMSMAFYSAAPPAKTTYSYCLNPTLDLGRSVLRVELTWRARLVWGSVEMVLGLCHGWIDRILPHFVLTQVLTPSMTLKVLDIADKVLFPLDGYPAPTPPDPTPEETQDMRGRLNRRLKEIIPRSAQTVVFPNGKVDDLLDPLGDSACNAHLVAMLLDSLVAALVPELVIGHGLSIEQEGISEA